MTFLIVLSVVACFILAAIVITVMGLYFIIGQDNG